MEVSASNASSRFPPRRSSSTQPSSRSRAPLSNPEGAICSVTAVTVDEPEERVTIAIGELLSSDEAVVVELKFHGILNDQLRGFYRSVFTAPGDPVGTVRTIATTHFEPTDARRAFPCFDEPDKKAVFSITVDVPEGLSAFSNWSVESEEALPSGGSRVKFGDTMPMSTYLAAVVVGPLRQTPPVDVDGTPVSVVHVEGKEHLTDYTLEAAAHSIRFFTEWFGIPYPAAKLDLVALPDFAMGAMENLGCVTFRESALLVDPRVRRPPSYSASLLSSLTRSHTCGSAISSQCGGGTGSG